MKQIEVIREALLQARRTRVNKHLVVFFMLFLVLHVFTCMCAYSQGTIKGKVIDKDNQTPLGYATVLLFQDGIFISGTYADEEGIFTFDSVPSGKYDIRIAHVGCDYYKIEGLEIEDDTVKDIGVAQLIFRDTSFHDHPLGKREREDTK